MKQGFYLITILMLFFSAATFAQQKKILSYTSIPVQTAIKYQSDNSSIPFFEFQENAKTGVMNKNGQKVMPANYEWVRFSEDDNGRYFAMTNESDLQVNAPDYLWEITDDKPVLLDSFDRVYVTDGYIKGDNMIFDYDMNPLITKDYSDAHIQNGYFALEKIVMRWEKDATSNKATLKEFGGWGIFTPDGDTILPHDYKFVIPACKNSRWVAKNRDDKMALFDLDGQQLTDWYDNLIVNCEANCTENIEYIIFYDKDDFGVITQDGQELFRKPQKGLNIGYFVNKGYVRVTDSLNQKGIWDIYGNEILAMQEEQFYGYMEDGDIIKIGEKLYHLQEKRFIDVDFQAKGVDSWSVIDNTNLLAVSRKDDSGKYTQYYYGIMDIEGNFIVPMKYREISHWNEGYTVVRNEDSEYGVIDTLGNIIIPFGKVPTRNMPSPRYPYLLDMYGEATFLHIEWSE